MMRFLAFLLVVAALGYGGKLFFDQKQELAEAHAHIGQLENELSKYREAPGGYSSGSGQPAVVAGSATFNPASQQMMDRHINCPACRSTGKMNIGGKITTCRLCLGTGGATLKAPPGATICKTCGGMKRTSAINGNRQLTEGCRACGGRGYGNR